MWCAVQRSDKWNIMRCASYLRWLGYDDWISQMIRIWWLHISEDSNMMIEYLRGFECDDWVSQIASVARCSYWGVAKGKSSCWRLGGFGAYAACINNQLPAKKHLPRLSRTVRQYCRWWKVKWAFLSVVSLWLITMITWPKTCPSASISLSPETLLLRNVAPAPYIATWKRCQQGPKRNMFHH